MLKKSLSIILATVLALSALCTFAFAEEQVYGDFKYIVKNGEVTITGCTETLEGEVVVPAEIEGYPVTVIDCEAFCEQAGMTAVELPDTLKTIEYGAFSLSGIEKIEIPDSVENIVQFAFAMCNELTYVKFGNGTKTFGGDTIFVNCPKLETVVISAGIEELGVAVFYNCSALKEFIVDENSNSYTAKDGILFSKDETKLCIYPAANESEKVVIPENVKEIGSSAFMLNESIKEIVLPEGLTKIGKYAFAGCPGITSVSIPESVTFIDDMAFEYCENLKTIYMPSGIYHCSKSAFEGCTGLEVIYYSGMKKDWANIDFIDLDPTSTNGASALNTAEIVYEHEHTLEISESVSATCTEDGKNTMVCKACGVVMTEVVPAKGHTETVVPAVEPTYDSTGLTEGKCCSECGEVLVEQQVVDKLEKPEEPETPDEPTEPEENKTFFDKIIEFFKNAVSFVKNVVNKIIGLIK